MKIQRFVFWSILLVVALFGVFAGGESMVRLIAPQSLSGGWFEDGPRGLVLNAASGTAVHAAGDTRVRYRFNRWHQRGRPPEPRALKILALGDSFTFGWLVEEHECFVGLLERQANRTFGGRRYQFLNAGTGGWGTADALAYLESFGALLRPRAVLLFINYDDVARSWRRGLYELEGGTGPGLIARNAPVQGAAFIRAVRSLPGYNWVVQRSHLLQLLRNLSVRKIRLGAPQPIAQPITQPVAQAGMDRDPVVGTAAKHSTEALQEAGKRKLMQALFRRFRQWTDAHRASLFVAATGWPGRELDWLDGVARAEGIAFFDARPQVRERVVADWDRYRLTGDGHPNAAGHRLIADAIWPWLEPRLAGLRQPRRSPGAVRVR